MNLHDEGGACRAFFEANHGSPRLVELLQAEPNRVAWETLTASKYSPGVVTSDERLSRIVISPTHVDRETGEIKPTEFFQDARDKGCSTDRLAFCSLEDSIKLGEKRALAWNRANPHAITQRQAVASVSLDVVRLRAIVAGGVRAYGVYDTALEEHKAHADICQLVRGSSKDQAVRSARAQLFDLANECRTPIPEQGSPPDSAVS